MIKGTVKWFDPKKCFGFIKPETGKDDIFLHISALEKAGLKPPRDNQEVEFEVVEVNGRKSADNIKFL